MLQVYEIRLTLETGYVLNVLTTAPTPEIALQDVSRILHGIGVKAGREYDPAETKVIAVDVRDTPTEAA